jgi:hypothetical protein
LQDAAAWASLAVLLLLAPVGKAYDLLGLPQPRPAGAFVAGGAALVGVAALLAWRGGARMVLAALIADVAGALALLMWLLVDDPATAWRGTAVLALVAFALVTQAVFDGVMLHQAGHAVEPGSDRASKR